MFLVRDGRARKRIARQGILTTRKTLIIGAIIAFVVLVELDTNVSVGRNCVRIGDKEIGPGHPTFIISEISGNHGGSKERAFQLIDAAKIAGADTVKFQAYVPSSMVPKSDHEAFRATEGPWKGSHHDLYEAAHTPREWLRELFDYAKSQGLVAFATPYCRADLLFLAILNPPCYKIASFELTDRPFLRAVNKAKKPVILSTGMASVEEIQMALEDLSDVDVALLHCVSAYPTHPKDANLKRLETLRWIGRLRRPIGLSDHSLSTTLPAVAVGLGVCIVEKHLRLSDVESEDSAFSLLPEQFAEMVRNIREAEVAMRDPQGDPEAESRQYRRRLVWTADLVKGTKIRAQHIETARARLGKCASWWDETLGAVTTQDHKSGTPVETI